MALLCLLHDDGETATAKAEALRDRSSYAYFCAIPRNPKALAQTPHRARTIIHLKNAISQCSEGVRDSARDRDLLARVLGGIAIDLTNGSSRGTTGEKESSNQCQRNQHSFLWQHSRPPVRLTVVP